MVDRSFDGESDEPAAPDAGDVASDLDHLLVQAIVSYAIYVVSPDGTVINWNSGAERLKGYRAVEIVGKNFARFYTDEDRAAGLPQRALQVALANGIFEDEGWRVCKDGQRFWARVTISPVYGQTGALIGFAKVTCDLTLQRAQADRIAQTSSQLDLALTNMSQGLCLFDADERLVFCSARWRPMIGVSEADAPIGTSLSDLWRRFLAVHDPAIGIDQIEERVVSERQSFLERLGTSTGTFTTEWASPDRTLFFSHRPLPGGGWVTTVDDVTQHRRIEERVSYLSQHDALTDLPNRDLLRRVVEDAWSVRDVTRSFAILYINLDRFRPINETYGHDAGDLVLRTVADRLRERLRQFDTAAKLGGDEFVVVARNCENEADLTDLARRLIDAIRQPIAVDAGFVAVSASIGIAVMPADGEDADALLQHANLALRYAKQRGNCSVFYEHGMEEAAKRRQSLEEALRRALSDGSFSLVYQPVVSLDDQRVTGFEALLRWTSATHGPMAPNTFIPFAEEIGLMTEIDDWILRSACREALIWPETLAVSVNLSATSFRRSGLVERVEEVLSSTGLAPHRLELEITETAAVDDLATAASILREIRALGVKIALDDFGTGYSSLSLLRALPFNRIKVDRSFVREIDGNWQSAAIVNAVIRLCRGLGVRATAEGVERVEEAHYLLREGCTDLQGYWISRPIKSELVLDWMQSFDAPATVRSLKSAGAPLPGPNS